MPLLKMPDKVLHLPNWSILTVVGLIEVATAILLLYGKKPLFKGAACLAITMGIASYRISWWMMGSPESCPCFGTVHQWLHIGENSMNLILVLTFLAVQASGVMLLYEYVTNAR
jgi:hypothetical protein